MLADSRRELRNGLRWFGSATLAMRVLDLLGTVVILRYLSQEQLGVASLASSVSIVAETLSGLGVAGAIVQAKGVSEREQSSLFWWCVGVALMLSTGVVLAASSIASFYGEPELSSMLTVSALKFLSVGAAVVPLQMLARELRFKELSIAQTAATMGEVSTKLALATLGFAAWAIVLANVLRGLYLLAAVLIITRWRVRLHFSRREIAPFVRFGVRIAGASLVSEVYRNVDYFLVGRYLGVATLGVYRVAFDLAMVPIEAIAQPIYRVSFAVLARMTNEKERLVREFLRCSRYLMALAGPVAVFLQFAGSDLLVLLGGERWLAAAPALGVLCWAAVARVATRLFSNLFNATGHPGLALVDAIVTLAVLATGMLAALQLFAEQWGILAVCYAWLAAYPLLFVVFWALARRVAQVRFRAYLAEHAAVLFALALSILSTAAAVHVAADQMRAIHAVVSLLSVALVTFGVYAAALRMLHLRMGNLSAA